MKQLRYVWRTLLRRRWVNLIKVVSLGLALTLSILLFARVAFYRSYDTCFAQSDRLYQLFAVWTMKGETMPPNEMNMGPVAGAILQHFPDEVEAATSVCLYTARKPLFNGTVQFDEPKAMADSLFFQTMGIEVLRGNTRELGNRDVVFLSDRLAARMFGADDPIGRVISYGKAVDLTVKGIYRALPENTRFRYEAILSMPTMWSRNWANYSWNGGDSFYEFIRLRKGVDPSAVTSRLEALMQHYLPSDVKASEIGYTTLAKPIVSVMRTDESVTILTLIMLLLGLSILFMAALNYVLISISSLNIRAKAIGVHKCNGASGTTIFGMFLLETVVILAAALLLMGFLLLNFRDFVEDTAEAPLSSLLAPERWWVVAATVLLLFVVGGVLPARLFARIPAAQVFRRYTDGKKGWKRPLLCVQFAGVALVSGLLAAVMMQYHHVLHKEMGYHPSGIAYASINGDTKEENDRVLRTLQQLPYVEDAAVAFDVPINGPSGSVINDEAGRSLFSSRLMAFSRNYPALMQMQLKAGRMPEAWNEVVVNETFALQMHWGEEVIGRQIRTEGSLLTVSGQLKEFKIGDYFTPAMPMFAYLMDYVRPDFSRCYHVKLKAPFADHLKRLNREVAELFPTKVVAFRSLTQTVEEHYNVVRVFRNITLVAAVTLFFIMLMGLIGYVSDEVRRRSKEIAVRKVNGAEATDILEMLGRDVLCMAVPAVMVGIAGSWYINALWMDHFTEQVPISWPFYVLIGIGVLVVIVGGVTVRAWKIAGENPVHSIRNE
ncbi:MAG: FtsX-like permease family protein [Prevotellaceae bacterium]|jgi:putative ABC transport system permease protein|nr:FtsX-like permease family protein [Prevotellaceae bacterium]